MVVAGLVFASAHDVNCGEQVRNLFNIGTWPESFREFCMDPEFLKMVIVIEDDSNPDRLENGYVLHAIFFLCPCKGHGFVFFLEFSRWRLHIRPDIERAKWAKCDDSSAGLVTSST